MQLRSTIPLFALLAVASGPACAQQGRAAKPADSTRASLSGSSPMVSAARSKGAATVLASGGRLVEPRAESPHFDFIRRTFTDFCYCWDQSRDSRNWSAQHFDLIMSGNLGAWRELNPKAVTLRYALLVSTLDEANKDKPSVNGKFLDDMRRWYARHREFRIEDAFLHKVSDGPADSTSRLNPHIWTSNRFVGNPTDPGWRAYSIDRMKWIAKEGEVGGIFLDEIDRGTAAKAYRSSREFQGADSTVWQNALVSLIADIRKAIAPKMLQINAAGYSGRDWEKALGAAAGSVHLETLNRATQELPSAWDVVDWYVDHDVYTDFVGLETWSDLARPSMANRYPGGDYASPPLRGKMVQLASYYMVVPSDPQRLGVQIENVRGFVPDSVAMRVMEYDVGHPLGERSVVLNERDPLGQRARVYRRDFDHAIVLIRPVTYWADTVMTNETKVKVPLPEGGPWLRVEPDGTTRPITDLWMRNSDAVILVHG
ncbi:MAG TPA: hypothetical protein VIR34_05885 [Gemmatimonadaceae bacterium]